MLFKVCWIATGMKQLDGHRKDKGGLPLRKITERSVLIFQLAQDTPETHG